MICRICQKDKTYIRLQNIKSILDVNTRLLDMDIQAICEECDNPKKARIESIVKGLLHAPVTNDNAAWMVK